MFLIKAYFFLRFTTSCLLGKNIDDPFQFLGDWLLKEQVPIPEEHQDVVRVSLQGPIVKPRSKCCSSQ